MSKTFASAGDLTEKMGWMPRSPNGIAMCQACDVKAQDKTGDGIHGRSYHHRH